MKLSSNYNGFLSLTLTVFFSFASPIILVGMGLLGLWGLSCLPGGEMIATPAIKQVLYFLATFGSGNPVYGSLTIGLAWGLVGGLFNLCTLYRHQMYNSGNFPVS
ncbi:hypothetical protein PN462_11665 [Spirulina sp. CS-785/01]|uniref:hypothetical protein n=1 Tax=Spirulina sp. CS-785/01 TaxID=3021716 RepID=UPI00232CB6E4|nr:hypothetical protein [Spirulina sp. CS-785/01]MDB9313759.1 hypothetical protein [Spirulina sp. CS-785/01]